MFMHGRSRHFSLDGTARLFVYSTCRVLPGSTRITGGTLSPSYLNSDLPVSGSDAAASATGVVASGSSGRLRSCPDGLAAISHKIAKGPDRAIPSLRTIPMALAPVLIESGIRRKWRELSRPGILAWPIRLLLHVPFHREDGRNALYLSAGSCVHLLPGVMCQLFWLALCVNWLTVAASAFE